MSEKTTRAKLEICQRDAIFSPCREYRYTLHRVWDRALPTLMFIGLNPSTADEIDDDPTIRRCIGFARTWGYGGLVMMNLFAYRSTDPKMLLKVSDPVGLRNDALLRVYAEETERVIAAWGALHKKLRGRDESVIKMLNCVIDCLGLTKEGFPKHPLFLRGDTTPVMWYGGGCNG